METQLTEKNQFVEEFGIYFERQQMPRMAGRILGWLLVCTPPHQAAEELMSALSASRGTVSTMTRLLINLGFVEKVGIPGERKDFFRLRPGVWETLFAARMGEITYLRKLAESGLESMAQDQAADRQRLNEMRLLYQYMEQETPRLIAEFHEMLLKGDLDKR